MIICAKRTLSQLGDHRIFQIEVNIVKYERKPKMLNKQTQPKTVHDIFPTIEAP